MDPHLLATPKSHPSGMSTGESIHGDSIINETWFMFAIFIALIMLLVSIAITLHFLYRRRKKMSKGLQHLSGD